MKIKTAILHILDKDSGNLICSQTPLDKKEHAVREYLNSVEVRLSKAEFKLGVLNDDSEVATLITSDLDFLEKSEKIAQLVFDSMAISQDAPSGDCLIFEGIGLDNTPYFGLTKFNYKPSFTHHVTYVEEKMQNNIIINQTIFPSITQKIDEGFLVNLDTLEVELVEKRYNFEGQKRLFFSERFLQIDPAPTVSENVKIVKKAVKEISKRYNEEEYVSLSQAQQAIFESIEDDGIIDNKKIADTVFSNNESAKQEYIELVEQTKFREEIPNNIPKYEKKFSKQKFKLTNGIELSVPSDVFQDKNLIEFINNPDGTVSVMIKNVEDIISKF